jgi:hypothetical protein
MLLKRGLADLARQTAWCVFSMRRRERPRVMLWPAFRDEAELLDAVHKAAYYLPPEAVESVALWVDFSPAFDLTRPSSWPRLDYVADIDGMAYDAICPVRGKAPSLATALFKADMVLAWDWPATGGWGPFAYSHDGPLYTVDRHRESSDGWQWASMLKRLQSPVVRRQGAEQSPAILTRHVEALPRFSKCYVFGTGPSLDAAWGMEFSDGYRIVCNTIVKNRELLAHIKPHFIVAGDAIFHYGNNRHAFAFRQDLSRALQETQAVFMMPDMFFPLLAHYHPEIARRTVQAETGVEGIHFNMVDHPVYHKFTHGNILNALLLPLASSLADDVFLLGFDGRAPGETYFWRNSDANAYNDLKPAIQAAHPAFWAKTDYVKYAQSHSDNAEQIMQAGERMGKRYVCLNESHIPAFRTRQAEDLSQRRKVCGA